MGFPFKSDQIVVAVDSFVMQLTPDLGDFLSISRGMRLRGGHRAVQRVPDLFLPDGSSDEDLAQRRTELQQARDTAEAGRREKVAVAQQPRPIPYGDRVICTKQAGSLGAAVKTVAADGQPLGALVGQVMSKHSKLVRLHCRDGTQRKVYAGQWLHADDPMVGIHFSHFERAPRPLRAPREQNP